jgi:plasmid stabilization system protein ParE
MVPITWTTEAQDDLEATLRYLARDSPRAADLLRERVDQAIDRIAAFPLAGRVVPEWDQPNVHEVFVGPYRLVYRVSESEIEVLLFIHGARLMGDPDVR